MSPYVSQMSLKKIVGDQDYYIDDGLLRPTDEPIIIGNIDKAQKLLRWRPVIRLEKTISDTLIIGKTYESSIMFIRPT